MILPLDSELATLETAGGKGASLARLARAGFRVPPGFIVGTCAYGAFVEASGLDELIDNTLTELSAEDPDALQAASRTIRAAFAEAAIPPAIDEEIRAAYVALSDSMGEVESLGPAVAVRSSATAEDLPGLSFAGQMDTFLNVIGAAALKEAIIRCWSSLWTARAIGYRARNGIPHAEVALAVVVQRMIASEASGVLFTANPLTGRRGEAVIDATLGLGEALVAGHVEPDHVVIDSASGQILERSLGAKAIATTCRAGGGTVTRDVDAADRPALDDAHLRTLARLGGEIETVFGAPQDIEWALADGELHVLQSRPITTLYPLPAGLPAEPVTVMLSFGAVQGMLDPMTPLGRDAVAGLASGGARLFGYDFTLEEQPILLEAGARLWLNLRAVVTNRVARRFTLSVLDYVDPAAGQILGSLIETEDWPEGGLPGLRTLLRLARPMPGVVGRALRTLRRPDAQREVLLHRLEAWLAECRRRGAAGRTLSERTAWIRDTLRTIFAIIIREFVPRFGMGMATYNLLRVLADSVPDAGVDARALMRGLPHNVTTEMDLYLWQTAEVIRADAFATAYCVHHEASTLAAEFAAGRLPSVVQDAIERFVERYGMRGVGEIDLGRQRWREDPEPLLRALQSYLRVTDAAVAPDAAFARGRQAAVEDIERLIVALQQTRRGWFKARLARWASRRMRALAGLRETPKFAIIRLFGLMRGALLAEGEALVRAGVLDRPDDVFFLRLAELETLGDPSERDWRALVRSRRQEYAREQRRRQVPRVLLSDGRAFYEGLAGSSEGALVGDPVSPGMAEGAVRVVLDPRGAELEPGEILVCPGTDPAWTPLFLTAGGLVMEVGGMMTHGAVVAREYGIPAVVGVHEATRRLETGQMVRVDGTSGRVVVLEGEGG